MVWVSITPLLNCLTSFPVEAFTGHGLILYFLRASSELGENILKVLKIFLWLFLRSTVKILYICLFSHSLELNLYEF